MKPRLTILGTLLIATLQPGTERLPSGKISKAVSTEQEATAPPCRTFSHLVSRIR
jgi:hypothetical protein